MFLWQSKTAWEGVKFLFKIKNVSISWDALSRGEMTTYTGTVLTGRVWALISPLLLCYILSIQNVFLMLVD